MYVKIADRREKNSNSSEEGAMMRPGDLGVGDEFRGTGGLYDGERRERESMKFPCARLGGERGTWRMTIIS